MAQVQSRPLAWGPILTALALGAALAGVAAWRVHVQSLEGQIARKRAAVKKLVVSGGIPPTQQVVEYLNTRQRFLEQRYQHWLETLTATPASEAIGRDPQLYFQEQVHEVQRTLERLAAARQLAVPESLGFPKELPPTDTVPRLLIQLGLIEDSATVVFERGVGSLLSVKLEDPEPVPDENGHEVFLTRLPVRLQLRGTLPQLMNILVALERVRPMVDVRGLSIVPPKGADSADDRLDVELVLARYLILATPPSPTS